MVKALADKAPVLLASLKIAHKNTAYAADGYWDGVAALKFVINLNSPTNAQVHEHAVHDDWIVDMEKKVLPNNCPPEVFSTLISEACSRHMPFMSPTTIC